MTPGETVLSGAQHPGTTLEVMQSADGWYIGFRDSAGLPYSRESEYFRSREYPDHMMTKLRSNWIEG